MKNKVLIVFAFLLHTVCFSQKEITWTDLAKITYTDKYFPDFDAYFMYPEFSASIKELDGKEITISGYFLSVDPTEKLHILSKGPMAACYFCGQGGPETAMELQFKNKPIFKTDNIIRVTGVLKLNQDDVNHFNYILTNCEGVFIE